MKKERDFESTDTSDHHDDDDDDEFVEDEYENACESEESTVSDDLDDEETIERRPTTKKSTDSKPATFKGRVIRVQQTDEGQSLKIARVKMEDRKFDGSTVRHRNVVNYLTSVLSARHEFYAEMWKQTSNAFLDCVDEVPNWMRSTRKSPNIERWLGTESVGFCVNSVANLPPPSRPPSQQSKPMGRPRKTDEDLKKPRRYILKSQPTVLKKNENGNDAPPMFNVVNGNAQEAQQCTSTTIEHVPIFQARSFSFSVLNMNFGGMESGVFVRDVAVELLKIYPEVAVDPNFASNAYKHLPLTFFNALKERHGQPATIQTLFCGGPISAMSACPRRSLAGEEVVAISTFADEKLFAQLDDAAHIQFWAYPSDLSSPAKLKFILEIPDVSHVLNMCWCPCFTDEFFSSLLKSIPSSRRQKASEHFAKTKNILGFLAVATNVGKVLIYCLPKDLDILSEEHSNVISSPPKKRGRTSKSMMANQNKKKPVVELEDETSSSQEAPPICTTTPKFVLQHPVSTMRIDEGSQEIFFKKAPKPGKCAPSLSASVFQYNDTMLNNTTAMKDFDDFPIFNLSWSCFEGCKRIAAVSAAGRILIWNLEDPASFDQPAMINSTSWKSPPVSVCWISANEVCISFRSKCSRIYNINSNKCLFKEDTAKTAGQFIYTNPVILPGYFAYDTSMMTFFNIFFSCSTYTFFGSDNREHAVVVPLFNSHQIQVSRLNVCELSGCVSTVGYDGRLYATLNGRLLPHMCELRAPFNIGRTIIHILAHSKKESPEAVLTADEQPSTSKNCGGRKPPTKKSKKGSNAATIDLSTEEGRVNASLDQIQQNIIQIKREVNGEEFPESPEKNGSNDNGATCNQENDDVAEPEKLCFSHADCCENKWLEIRVGDAAMKDQVTLRRVKTKIPDVALDRRLESFSFVEYSHVTPCLSMSGGEAGLVFIMSSIL